MTETAPRLPQAPLPRLIGGRVWLRVVVVLAGSWILAASSWAEVPMVPVPMTLQTLALFTLAGLAGLRLSFEIVLVWLLQAALGLPVLAGGASGVEALTGPTAGYLAGMLVAAPLAGRIAERTRGLFTLIAAFLAGHAVVLAAGWLRLTALTGAEKAFADGVAPFILGAIAKSLAAAALVKLADLALPKARRV
jgi:biotin transport system substrate-specific component